MQFSNIKTYNWAGAFRGMRNPLNSWDKSDSYFGFIHLDGLDDRDWEIAELYIPDNLDPESVEYQEKHEMLASYLCETGIVDYDMNEEVGYAAYIGPKDMKLARNLIKAGGSDRKYLRQIGVCLDITAPLYW